MDLKAQELLCKNLLNIGINRIMRNNYKSKVTIACLALLISIAANAEKLFPNGCTSDGFSFSHYTLNLHLDAAGQTHSIYFMYNKSNHTVRLYQMRNDSDGYVMNLNNEIHPFEWGVFAINDHDTKFICTRYDRDYNYGKIIDCEDVFRICEYPNVKFAANNYGNYWAVQSKSRSSAIRSVVRQGVLLKW